MNMSAMASDAVSVINTVIGRYFMNPPIMPGHAINGRNTARVVPIDAVTGQNMRFAAFA